MILLATTLAEVYLPDPAPDDSPPCHRCLQPAVVTIGDVGRQIAHVLCGECLLGALASASMVDSLNRLADERASRARAIAEHRTEPETKAECQPHEIDEAGLACRKCGQPAPGSIGQFVQTPAQSPAFTVCSRCGQDWSEELSATYCSGTVENPTPHVWVPASLVAGGQIHGGE